MADSRFDRWSSTYDDSWLQRIFFVRVHAGVLGAIPATDRPGAVLDIGCGTGRLLSEVQSRWPTAELIGVDPAPGMILEAKRRLPSSTLLVASAEQLPLDNHTVDLAVTTMSFHHWTDQRVAVKEIARVLRPGGRFLLADHTAPWWLRWHREVNPLPPESVGSLLKEAGLHVDHRISLFTRWVWLLVAVKPTAT